MDENNVEHGAIVLHGQSGKKTARRCRPVSKVRTFYVVLGCGFIFACLIKVTKIAVMFIHSINSSIQNQYVPVCSQTISKTLSTEQVKTSDDVVDLSQVAQSVGTASSKSREKFDFTEMTPKQMKGIANELFKQGKIDLDQLFQLETAGIPLGKLGAHGEFVELTAAERDGFMNQPMNYIQYTSDRISFLEQSGYSNDPKSGYDMLKSLLGQLKANFG